MTAFSLLTIAEQAVDAGISVVPPRTDGTKAPLGSWRMFQARLPYAQELDNWYRAEQNPGIGVVCGAVSGNLEAVDFDRHSVFLRKDDTQCLTIPLRFVVAGSRTCAGDVTTIIFWSRDAIGIRITVDLAAGKI